MSKNHTVRVGFLISTLNRAGAESKLVDVANKLDKKRFKPYVFVLKTGPLVEALEVPVRDMIIPSKYDCIGFLRLINLFRKAELKILWIVGTGDVGFFGRLAAFFAGIRHVIQSYHATTRPDGKPTIDLTNKIINKIPILTEKYVAVAKKHMQHLIENEGVDSSRLVYIHNGVDLKKFCPTQCAAERKYPYLDIPDDVPIVGIVARFKPEKRHDLFLKAGKIVVEKFPSAKLLIVGDGPLRNEVMSMADRMNLLKSTVFTGGLDNVLPALHMMDVSVLCSDMEAFPNAVLESMAAGVPVVSTDVGSVSEAITDGENGFLVPRNDPRMLAESICKLLSDTNLADKITKNALDTVKRNFSLGKMIEQRENLFEEMISNAR